MIRLSRYVTAFSLVSFLHGVVAAQVMTPGGQPDPAHPNLYAWFDAGNGVNNTSGLIDGTSVFAWFDLTGKFHSLAGAGPTANEQPVYYSNTALGHPAVSFDGNDYLFGNATNQFGTISSTRTIFFVASTKPAGGVLMDSADVAQRHTVYVQAPPGQQRWTLSVNPALALSTSYAQNGLFQVHTIVVANGLQQYYINGTLTGTSTQTPGNLAGLTLGTNSAFLSGFSGDLAELLIYDTGLGATDRNAIETYLKGKYPAVPVLDGTGAPNIQFPPFYAWFNAAHGVNGATGTPADGVSVTLWTDTTFKGHDLTAVSPSQVDQPVFRANLANGNPSVAFDGTDYIAGPASQFGNVVGGKTIFCVTRLTQGQGYLFDSLDANNRNAVYMGELANPNRWGIFSGFFPVTWGPNLDTNVYQVHTILFEPLSYKHYINSINVSTGGTTIDTLGGLVLGARYTLNERMRGDIAEFLVFDSVLDADSRAQVEKYLYSKFPVVQKYASPGAPQDIAAGDFDRNGVADLAVANANHTIVPLTGGTGGTFAVGASTAVGTSPQSILLADLDASKWLDIVTANSASNNISILLNNNSGGFAAPVNSASGTGTRGLAAADMDQDGRQDLLVVNETAATLSYFQGNGNGTFAAPTNYNTGSGSQPRAVVAADVTGDGVPDVIVGNFGTSDAIFFTNNGAGVFVSNPSNAAGGPVNSIAAGDLNLDGFVDFATANETNPNAISIFYLSGMGFSPALNLQLPAAATDVRVLDANRDGVIDVVAASQTASQIYLIPATTPGFFANPVPLAAGTGPRAIAPADFDSDGRLDFAVANFNIKSVSIIPSQDPSPAGLVAYGNGTPGCLGRPAMLANDVVRTPNATLAFTCTNAPANALGLGFVGDVQIPLGADQINLGITIHVDLFLAGTLIPFDIVTDGEGNGFAPFPLPTIPGLVGLTFYCQSIFVEPPGRSCTIGLLNLVTSRGLALTVQP